MKRGAPAVPRARVLLAEDRSSLRAALSEVLAREGYEVVQAQDGREAMAKVVEGGFDIALLDLKMPVHSGIELLGACREAWPAVPVILLTAYGSIETAVAAMKAGAHDFISKPVDPDLLLLVVSRALEADRLRRVSQAQSGDLSRSPAYQSLVGESPAFLESQRQASKIAPTDTTVLLLGETGVGKELFARAIHVQSPRRGQPFVAVNCAAIPGTLLENELFGHEKGAYTGAHEARAGRFELAHRGTLFLDEIGEMHHDLQSKLLRAIEEKTFHRVGGTQPVRVDVRLICATNREIEAAAAAGTFRRDLYYRISSFPVVIPPLRERTGDIRLLARHYLSHFAREMGRQGLSFSEDSLSHLEAQPWPGNVRELMNRIERAVILAEGEIVPGDLAAGAPPSPAPAAPPGGHPSDPEAWLEKVERWKARELLKRCGGDKRRAARLLGLRGDKFDHLLEG